MVNDDVYVFGRSSLGSLSNMTLYDTKFPSSILRSLAQRSSLLQSGMGFLNESGGGLGGGGPGRANIWSLYDRFNEPAPPPYDARMRAQAGIHLSSKVCCLNEDHRLIVHIRRPRVRF